VNPVVRAVALGAGACLLFTLETVIAKLIAGVPIATIVLARAVGQLAWPLAFAGRDPVGLLRTRALPMQIFRGLLSVVSWYLYFYALARLPLATATVLSFTSILFVTALAAPVLRERVGPRRWAATLVGFAGVVVILQPGSVPLDGAVLAAIGSAAFGGTIVLTTKLLARTERTETIMLYIGLVAVAVALPVALPGLAWPGMANFGLLLMAGLCGPFAMHLWINALRLADASLIAPIAYIRLVFAAGFGLLLWGEVPDWTLGLGAALIIGSALYITRREAVLARARRP